MQLCRLALPGANASALPMYWPEISPRNSLATLRWNGGGRNVCSATDQRGGKQPNSMFDGARHGRRRRQHAVDRRVGVVEGDRVDALEPVEVVLERHVVAAPRDDVERRVIDLGLPQAAAVLGDDAEVAVAILERRDRREEVARVGEAERADRTEIRQPQLLTVVLADVAAGRSVGQLDAELDAARDQADLAGRDVEDAELGVDAQRGRAAARSPARRRRRRRTGRASTGWPRDMWIAAPDCCAGSPLPPSVTMPSTKSVGAVGIGIGLQRSWFGVGGTSLNGPLRIRPAADRPERLVRGRRADAVGPVGPADAARRREGRAVQLLDVEAERRLLRRVLVPRQRAGNRLGGELVAESRLIPAFGSSHGEVG